VSHSGGWRSHAHTQRGAPLLEHRNAAALGEQLCGAALRRAAAHVRLDDDRGGRALALASRPRHGEARCRKRAARDGHAPPRLDRDRCTLAHGGAVGGAAAVHAPGGLDRGGGALAA